MSIQTTDAAELLGCVVEVPRDHARSLRPGSSEQVFWDSLVSFLLAMIPMFVIEMRDWSDTRMRAAQAEAAELIAYHGDDLQYGGKFATDSRVALAKGLAILARAEGGVTSCGVHACLAPHIECPNPRRQESASEEPAEGPDTAATG